MKRMPLEELGVDTSVVDGNTTIVLSGELDLATAPPLREKLLAATENGTRHLTLDLAGLTFIDSTGLSLFVDTYKRLNDKGADMVLRNPTDTTRRILDISGIGKLLPIIDG